VLLCVLYILFSNSSPPGPVPVPQHQFGSHSYSYSHSHSHSHSHAHSFIVSVQAALPTKVRFLSIVHTLETEKPEFSFVLKQIAEVMEYAAEVVNNDTSLLPGRELAMTQYSGDIMEVETAKILQQYLMKYGKSDIHPLGDSSMAAAITHGILPSTLVESSFMLGKYPFMPAIHTGTLFADRSRFPYIWSTTMSDTYWSAALSQLCVRYNWKRVAIVFPLTEELTVSATENVHPAMAAVGVKLVLVSISPSLSSSSISAAIDVIVNADMRILFVDGQFTMLRNVMLELQSRNLQDQIQVIGLRRCVDSYNIYSMNAEAHLYKGVIGIREFDPAPSARLTALTTALQQRFYSSFQVLRYHAAAFDAVQVLAHAVHEYTIKYPADNSTDTPKLYELIKSAQVPGTLQDNNVQLDEVGFRFAEFSLFGLQLNSGNLEFSLHGSWNATRGWQTNADTTIEFIGGTTTAPADAFSPSIGVELIQYSVTAHTAEELSLLGFDTANTVPPQSQIQVMWNRPNLRQGRNVSYVVTTRTYVTPKTTSSTPLSTNSITVTTETAVIVSPSQGQSITIEVSTHTHAGSATSGTSLTLIATPYLSIADVDYGMYSIWLSIAVLTGILAFVFVVLMTHWRDRPIFLAVNWWYPVAVSVGVGIEMVALILHGLPVTSWVCVATPVIEGIAFGVMAGALLANVEHVQYACKQDFQETDRSDGGGGGRTRPNYVGSLVRMSTGEADAFLPTARIQTNALLVCIMAVSGANLYLSVEDNIADREAPVLVDSDTGGNEKYLTCAAGVSSQLTAAVICRCVFALYGAVVAYRGRRYASTIVQNTEIRFVALAFYNLLMVQVLSLMVQFIVPQNIDISYSVTAIAALLRAWVMLGAVYIPKFLRINDTSKQIAQPILPDDNATCSIEPTVVPVPRLTQAPGPVNSPGKKSAGKAAPQLQGILPGQVNSSAATSSQPIAMARRPVKMKKSGGTIVPVPPPGAFLKKSTPPSQPRLAPINPTTRAGKRVRPLGLKKSDN
jgi:Receptor family ligand binding region/7 transmembrane sweet-taste receptor of 3 GCPR